MWPAASSFCLNISDVIGCHQKLGAETKPSVLITFVRVLYHSDRNESRTWWQLSLPPPLSCLPSSSSSSSSSPPPFFLFLLFLLFLLFFLPLFPFPPLKFSQWLLYKLNDMKFFFPFKRSHISQASLKLRVFGFPVLNCFEWFVVYVDFIAHPTWEKMLHDISERILTELCVVR